MANAVYAKLVAEAIRAEEGKAITVDQEGLSEQYFATLPEGVDREIVEKVASHEKEWGNNFHRFAAEPLANYAKTNPNVDNATVEFKTPFATYALDYARPTAEDASKEDRVNSFSLRCSVDAEEGLLSDVRSRIGNLYD